MPSWASPTETVAPGAYPVPLMVTVVPAPPPIGLIELIVGGSDGGGGPGFGVGMTLVGGFSVVCAMLHFFVAASYSCPEGHFTWAAAAAELRSAKSANPSEMRHAPTTLARRFFVQLKSSSWHCRLGTIATA